MGMLGAGVTASPALAQDRLTVDVSASAGVSNNPYQSSGSSPTVAEGTIDVHPSWVMDRPLTKFSLDGDVQATFYSKDLGDNESAAVTGSGSHQLSSYTSLYAALSYTNSIVGSVNGARVGIPVPLPVTTVDPAAPIGVVETPLPATQLPNYLLDPSLGGFGERRQAYQATGGVTTALSPRDQVSANVSASVNRYGGGFFSDFNSVNPSLSYSRALGDRFNVGATMQVGFTDYLGTSFGDAIIYSPALTASRGLSNGWELSASLGASIVDFKGPTGLGSRKSATALSGSFQACKQTTRVNFCGVVSRQTSPSAVQDIRVQTSVTGSVGLRLSARDTASFSAGYSHTGDSLSSAPVIQSADNSIDYLTLSGTYSRQLRPALSAFISAGYGKAYEDVVRRDASLSARAGISYRFGRN